MIIVALGSNLHSTFGTPEETLHHAIDILSAQIGSPKTISQFWSAPAWPNPSDPTFVNAVATFSTELPPTDLLGVLHGVERDLGRDRAEGVSRNAPRTLDLDLIDYDGLVQGGPPMLPHPRMHERAFVLVPLREVAPEWRHPVSGLTVDEMIAVLPQGAVRDMEPL